MTPLISTAQRICGWCARQMAPGTQPATTGICPRCFVRVLAEEKGGA
jgi:hypothetical protein